MIRAGGCEAFALDQRGVFFSCAWWAGSANASARLRRRRSSRMSRYLGKLLDMTVDDAVPLLTHALAAKGFAVLTTIDVRAVMKQRLDAELRPHVMIGACNPHFTWRALQAEGKIGICCPATSSSARCGRAWSKSPRSIPRQRWPGRQSDACAHCGGGPPPARRGCRQLVRPRSRRDLGHPSGRHLRGAPGRFLACLQSDRTNPATICPSGCRPDAH